MKMTLILTLFLSLAAALPTLAQAAIKTETVEYKQGDTILEGYLAYDDARPASAKTPGVLVFHEWLGLDDYAKSRARQLAELGYVAFAADVYGKGIHPKNNDEAGKEAGRYKSDRLLMRKRAEAALDTFKKNPRVDPSRIAAIGYCFGGTVALELARSGAPLDAVVTFHGGLDTPTPGDAKNIRGKILALHGADDPFVTAKDVAAFEEEMRKAKLDWELVLYGNAVHRFSNPSAGDKVSSGAAYNEKADKRSWETMKDFLKEAFKSRV